MTDRTVDEKCEALGVHLADLFPGANFQVRINLFRDSSSIRIRGWSFRGAGMRGVIEVLLPSEDGAGGSP